MLPFIHKSLVCGYSTLYIRLLINHKNTKQMTTTKHNPELVSYAIDGLSNVSEGVYACDLHNELFNTDYFIIGYYQAEEWLKAHPGIFAAIEEIREYEQSNFGQVSTDFSSSEKVVNMYAYIKGEEILNDCPTLRDKWDSRLTAEDIEQIKSELEEMIWPCFVFSSLDRELSQKRYCLYPLLNNYK